MLPTLMGHISLGLEIKAQIDGNVESPSIFTYLKRIVVLSMSIVITNLVIKP